MYEGLWLLQLFGYARQVKEYEGASKSVGEALSPEKENRDDLKRRLETRGRELAELWTQQRAAGVANVLDGPCYSMINSVSLGFVILWR